MISLTWQRNGTSAVFGIVLEAFTFLYDLQIVKEKRRKETTKDCLSSMQKIITEFWPRVMEIFFILICSALYNIHEIILRMKSI